MQDELSEPGEWRTPFARFWLHGLVACAGFGLTLALVALRVVLRVRRDTISRDAAHMMHRLVCPPLRMRVSVANESTVDSAMPCVFIANHQSYLDYPVLARMLRTRTIVVGKSEMRRIPLVGWLFRSTGNVFIARNDGRSAQQTLETLATRLRNGCSVWIFPEGTRRRNDAHMLPFRTGAFRLAAMSNVPIVPIVLSSLKPGVDISRRRLEPTELVISVLAPRYVQSPDRADVLNAISQTRAEMIDVFLKTSRAV